MTRTEIQKFVDEFGVDVEIVDHWECPAETSAKLLTMPNIPLALQGKGMQPRTIYGARTWEFMRKKCYFNANYKSEITGIDPPKGQLHAHELFSYDYAKQEGVFQRIIALAKMEHDFIHSGRLITLYREGNPTIPRSYLLKVVENGFKIISEYNEAHPDEEPLRCYGTFLQFLRVDDIRNEVLALIRKYNIKFYNEVLPKSKQFKGWHVIVGNKRYNSPYARKEDWEEAMKVARKNDFVRNLKNPFAGGAYEELREAMKNVNVVKEIPGCKPGRVSKRK